MRRMELLKRLPIDFGSFQLYGGPLRLVSACLYRATMEKPGSWAKRSIWERQEAMAIMLVLWSRPL